jgi:hypothetical protein
LKTPMGRLVQENSRRSVVKKSLKLVRMEYTNVISAKVTSLEITHLVIKNNFRAFPWFHQEADVLMGLITCIYLFIYFKYRNHSCLYSKVFEFA